MTQPMTAGASLYVGAAGTVPAYSGAVAGVPLGTGRKGVKWDEATIAEHDKERGTRTRILEPKTPFRHLRPGEDDDGLHASSTPPDAHVGAHSTSHAVLHEPWDGDGDAMPHDEWDAMTGSSGSPSGSTGRRASHTTDDDMDEDDGSRRAHAHFSGPSSDSAAAHGRGVAAAVFAPVTVAHAGTLTGVPVAASAAASGFVPDPHDAEFDSEEHRAFLARRRQHYNADLNPQLAAAKGVAGRSLREILARGAAHVDADEDEDDDML